MISAGYFLYDFIDMYFNARDTLTEVIIAHHILSFSATFFLLIQSHYVVIGTAGLLFEIHSIIYHIRNLMIISGKNSKENPGYVFILVCNYLFFLVFRVVANIRLCYMVYKNKKACQSRKGFYTWFTLSILFLIVNSELVVSMIKKDGQHLGFWE